jgi:D-3-phosphoglycerate dehydrogenase / 2-oxoglutarate reductase
VKITILDDTLRFVRSLPFMGRLADHEIDVWNDHTKDVGILAERLRDTEALILLRERTPIRAPLIQRLPKLRMITLNGPYPHVDVDACTARGVLMCAGAPRPSSATAELTWGLIIAAMRRIPQEMERLKTGQWQGSLGTGLKGRTLGVYGYGTIGRQVANFGRAFGMKVIVCSREAGLAAARADGHEAVMRDALFEQADVLTLHVRLKPETRGIIGADLLMRMKPTALFVNTSRAELLQPGALVAALRAGRPGLAACDVYETEPLTDTAHALINLPNVVCTPHLGYFERDQLERYYNDQCERVLAYARGEPMDVVNPAALTQRPPA